MNIKLPFGGFKPAPIIENLMLRLPLTLKMIAITLITGLLLWTVVVKIYSGKVRDLFMAQLKEGLARQAEDDRRHFDGYVKAYYRTAKIFTRLKNYSDYVEKQKWSPGDTIRVRYHSGPPEWLPPVSVFRSLILFRYAILLDPQGRGREVYRTGEGLPPLLLGPPSIFLSKSYSDSFMTTIEGVPHIIAAEISRDPEGRPQSILMLASPIDENFLRASVTDVRPGHAIALLTPGESPVVIASNKPDELPPGIPLEKVTERFVFMSKAFFDYGSSDLLISFASLISKDDATRLSDAVVSQARQRLQLSTLAFMSSFVLITFFLTGRLRKLTANVSAFSSETLGVRREDTWKGDEIYILERQFERLKKDVIEAREEVRRTAKREAEEKTRLIVNNAFDAIITINAAGVITTWNPRAEMLFGYSEKEMLGVPLTRIMPERFRDAHIRGMKRALSDREYKMRGRVYETLGLRSDGRERPVELTIAKWRTGEETFFTGIIRDIAERKTAEEKMRASLREKEVLLREIHHRVKNNLQVISSILHLQSGYVRDEQSLMTLRESSNRIDMMALIHEKLYQSKSLSKIDFREYIGELITSLFLSHGVNMEKIKPEINAEGIFFDINTAIPCGLIIHELVSNCLKYAFPGERSGKITAGLYSDGEGRFTLTVSDDGIGLPEDFDLNKAGTLGLKLVAALTGQLDGTVNVIRNKGTTFKITFPEVGRKQA
ncbi:MAG: PAS domain S-box protein [Nitrospiraceae bacterium]|nr:MAG: PAS domain S-box protein [Nitrospiraceae bacterium]